MSALGSFKLILCPKGGTCPHLDCLFKHPDEDDKGVRRQSSQSVQAPPTNTAASNPLVYVDGGPRKRQKISDRTTTSHLASDNHIPTSNPETSAFKSSASPVPRPEETADFASNDSNQHRLAKGTPKEAEYDPASPAWATRDPISTAASPHTSGSRVISTIVPSGTTGPDPAQSPLLTGPTKSGQGITRARPTASGQPTADSQSLGMMPETRTPLSHRISPPPLKRKLSTPDPPTSKSKKQATQTPSSTKVPRLSTPSSTPASIPSSYVEKSKPKQRKPEGLNPRLVTPAPASHDLRLRLLKLLHAEFARLNTDLMKKAKHDEKKLVLSDQELIWRALDEEEHATRKGPIYTNVIKNKIMSYKRMTHASWLEERRKQSAAHVSPHDGAKPNPDGKLVETGLKPVQEIEIAKRLLTPIDGLASHGYVPHIPDEEEVEKVRKGVEAAMGWEKCDRCSRRFQVFPGRDEKTGALTSSGSCTFHPGKTYYPEQGSTRNDAARPVKRWKCCHEAYGDSVGCTTSENHVFKATDPKRLSTVLSFTETPANPDIEENAAFCFDCEMGYTVHGLELIRLTVVTWPTGKVALDILVQPKGEVLDLNSRYSGVFPEDIANAEKWTRPVPPPVASNMDEKARVSKGLKIVNSPEAARKLFYALIRPETILIGHGLENDLNVCRMVHPNLIDTILLFPHPRRLPSRYGLKALALNHLGMKIQVENDGQGHDSAEDARAAGELVRLKVKQEWTKMQGAGWKLVDGQLVPPPARSLAKAG